MANIIRGGMELNDQLSAISNGTTTFDKHQMFNLGSEAAATLHPLGSPFFTYLARVAKENTDDPEFKNLEDRAPSKFTDRNFYLDGAHDISGKSVGDTTTFTVDDGSGNDVEWLIKGMVFAINLRDVTNDNPEPVHVRIESVPQHNGSETTLTGRILADPTSSIGDHSSNDNTQAKVIGTAFPERSGAPDVWSEGMDDVYGYTEIFKTAYDESFRSMATRKRGMPGGSWQRGWGLKTNEHKADIENAMLYGQKAKSGSGPSEITYTDGIVGFIFREATPVVSNTADLAYSAGKPYLRQIGYDELTYDIFLEDAKVLTDPARGGSRQKLVLAGRNVMSWFNKIGSNSFLDNSVGYSGSAVRANFDLSMQPSDVMSRANGFANDYEIMRLKLGPFAEYNFVEEPMFNGPYADLMVIVDLAYVKYRPLVANGWNFDTVVFQNVQANDDSGRKDMLYTDAGLEILMGEQHMAYSFDAS